MKKSLIKKTLLGLALTLSIPTFSFAQDYGTVVAPIRDPFVKMTKEINQHQPPDPSVTQYPFTQLQLTGILQLGNDSRAIFRDPNGRLHQLKIGETVGPEQAKITGIFADKIVLTAPHTTQATSPATIVLNLP